MRSTRQRLDELLLARATTGLRSSEAAELARLIAAHPEVDQDAYDHAAAAVCLATLDTSEALPDSVWEKLERRASEFLAGATPARH